VNYRDHQRLSDIQAAIDAIRSHLQRGDLSDGLIFDAVRIRLLEIGEAVKALPAELLDTQPSILFRGKTREPADVRTRPRPGLATEAPEPPAIRLPLLSCGDTSPTGSSA
jgi:hypothetical protein